MTCTLERGHVSDFYWLEVRRWYLGFPEPEIVSFLKKFSFSSSL